ncbi:uncharacterized protein SAMN05421736_12630 [Evansella caseinilytica]|uniref:Radical SAM core domain-containing protein n=1 Tax=Evansella caseinilytica TaxID=1503961 RepID=A0A1H3UV82_9BACI|nr:anaerobic sulfatase maturase [Evansella caseinilytica]SDZ65745.1 uncharacterized protein SAMN05421736_12630 [Evansella caseinilytica]
MNALTILIKPASASCNMACSYCFYYDVGNHRAVKSYGIMGQAVRRSLIKKAFACGAKQVSFAFQGGEPTLAGLNYYRLFTEEVNRYNTQQAEVSYSIQTNGYAIDEEWADFFQQHHFLVGVSIDGPAAIHDHLRKTTHHKPTHQKIIENLKLLEAYQVPVNILCVLSSYVAKNIQEVYEFFQQHGFRYLQFIPCLHPLGEKERDDPHALNVDEYKQTLDTLFTYYKQNFYGGNYISDRLFDNYVRMGQGFAPESCALAGACTTYFVIEANGDVYPCDFYALDELKLGNILDSGYVEMFTGPIAAEFRRESGPLSQKCQSCKHLALCRGGCKRYKILDEETNENHLYYCEAYYDFFEKHTEAILEMGKKVMQGYVVK